MVALLNGWEVLDLIAMCAFVGFIFKDFFRRRSFIDESTYDPLKAVTSEASEGFWRAVAIVGPAIFLHEMGHKFVAMSFGMSATFNAAYGFLFLGLILKLLNFPFIFFVPAYVSIQGITGPLEHSITAFAGPLVNLVLWLSAAYAIKARLIPKKYLEFGVLTAKVNKFLFIFNMIPIPGFDGSKVVFGLIEFLRMTF